MTEDERVPSETGRSADRPARVLQILSRTWKVLAPVCVVSLLLGGAVGYLAARRPASSVPSGPAEVSTPQRATQWTCSMHPQIKLPKPGQCPICFMDLIPLDEDTSGEGGPRQLKMSREAVALAGIQTTPVWCLSGWCPLVGV